MKKEKVKRESPYKGIFRFASAKKQQLTFSLFCLFYLLYSELFHILR